MENITNLELSYHPNGKFQRIKQFTQSGDWLEYTYDQWGNALSITDSNGTWSSWMRDEFGDKISYNDSDGIILVFKYNG